MASQGQRLDNPARWLVLIASVVGSIAAAANEARPSVPSPSMTLDVEWSPPPARPTLDGNFAPKSVVELALTAGWITEATLWPIGSRDGGLIPSGTIPPRVQGDGSWLVGLAPRGKVRVRIEAPLSSDLMIRIGGQAVRIGLMGLLEGVQKSSTAGPHGVEVVVERLPWDAIQVELGAEDGTAESASVVPLGLRFNILTPEIAEVALRCSAELRPVLGGEPVWRQDWREVISTNNPSPPPHALNLTMPGPEGTYLLEVRTDWEPLGDPAGTRLGRWVRRRRNPTQTTSATRRLTVAVVHSRTPAPVPLTKADGSGIEVDAIDLTRSAGHRPSASGRSVGDPNGRWSWAVPDSALVAPALRDRLRGWIGRSSGELATLAAPDPSGLAWSAVGLKVPHPDRPHRLTLTVVGGHPAALGVAVVAEGGPRSRVVLDACASGVPIFEGGPPSMFSWMVWPGDEAPVVVLVNRGPSAPVQVGSITLTELGDLTPAAALRESERSVGLHLASVRELDRFGGGDSTGHFDPLVQAKNLTTYLIHSGASSAVLPDGLGDRALRRALGGQADEDSTGPDRLNLILRVFARRNCSAWVDVAFEGPMPGLPPVDSPEAAGSGLLRVDRLGRPDGLAYQPIHPKVREAMARKVADAVRARQARPNLLGALVRLGPGSTLPGGPDSGLDDLTYARFVNSVFEPGPAGRVPGRNLDDPRRFEARARFVEAAGKIPWLAWKAREVASVYSSLADAARGSAPGAILAVATPTLDSGPAGDEARRVDLAGLGPGQAWRGVGLDLAAWPSGEGAPVVLRATGLSTDDLAHDLATSPELDELVAARPGRGALIGVEAIEPSPVGPGPKLSARPMAEGASGDEPFGHALAAIDAARVFVAASSVAGQEERLRRFARVFASLPAPQDGAPEPRLPSGVVARASRSGADTYLAMANDSPYPILLEAILGTPGVPTVDDLGRGIRLEPEKGRNAIRLVVELAPFGVSAFKVGSPEVRLLPVIPHPGPAVLDGMKAQYEDLSTALARLNRLPTVGPNPPIPPGPVNPGFEPDPVVLASAKPSGGSNVAGWDLLGELASSDVDRDRPHGGRGSLRLDARGGPASIASAPFRPEARTNLLVRGWLRTDRAEAKVRVRVEGQSSNRSYLRQFDLIVRGDWTEVAVRATQIPEGGLDTARVRFELLGPGRLWVDDVSVVGDLLGESERLNARRDLMAALSAYREKRYADFARLAGSHWARNVAGGPPAATVAGDRSGVIRTGDASALPPGRRLR